MNLFSLVSDRLREVVILVKDIKIIAEIGVNHDGSINKARSLIEASAKVGVHAVKFQYRNLENAYSDSAREIGDEILLKEIKKTHLEPEILIGLVKYAHELGLEVGISFFDGVDMEDFGKKIDCFDFFKLPSAELTNAALIKVMLETGKHTYLSTGCHSEAELEAALGQLPEGGWTPLHCISNYPTSIQNARLGYLQYLKNKWNRDVGYSSHDDDWESCLLAMQLGATVIERHITLDRLADGLDHSSSSTPDEFERLCLYASNMDILLSGNAPRVSNQGELLNRQNLGRSFFTNADLYAGDALTMDSLVYRSPNTGIGRTDIDDYLGKPIAVDIPKGGVIAQSVFQTPKILPLNVIDFAKQNGLSLPVRLHDLSKFQALFPIGAYEFHLSFDEIRREIDVNAFDKTNRYSVHLPDYVNPTQLMDPFSIDLGQRDASRDILERTVNFAQQLQQLTGSFVPVVGSFSVMHSSLVSFYNEHAALLDGFKSRDVIVMPQWLPPIAWYFGGSVRLHAVNQMADVELFKQYDLPVCMDVCHLIMGRNFFGFSAEKVMQDLKKNTQHIHIADAAGIDGEGFAIGEGEPQNMNIIRKTLDYDCLKVIEVWQGHLDNGAGFYKALTALSNL
ncbi:MAG: sialic acid synthase SpsE [Oleiphilaceae bacterium]